MTEHIIYIKGVACPYSDGSIAEETERFAKEVGAFQAADHKVAVVGNPSTGFLLNEVETVLWQNPETNTVIVDAHGNIKDGKHFIAALNQKDKEDESWRLWATDFYKTLACASSGKPLNIFMFSCGSGNGCEEAIGILPAGSTLINFTEEDKVDSYIVKPQAFEITAYPGVSLAERLFLNILCKGFDKHRYLPQISVDHQGTPAIWTLWDVARNECLEHETFSSEIKNATLRHLGDYLSRETILAGLATIELYAKIYELPNIIKIPSLEDVRTPVKIPLHVDFDGFYQNVIDHELLGPLCAIAFSINREKMGAFQIALPEFYLRPNTPERGANSVAKFSVPTAGYADVSTFAAGAAPFATATSASRSKRSWMT